VVSGVGSTCGRSSGEGRNEQWPSHKILSDTRGSSDIEGSSKPRWPANKDVRETVMFFAFTSGFLSWFSNRVSFLERADRIAVMGRESRYVGSVEVALRRYSGHMSY
jgi:hypothetical protein